MSTTFPEAYYKKVINLLLSQSNMLDYTNDPEPVLTSTLELLSHFLSLNNGRVFLWDTQTDKLVIRYSYGLSREQINVGKYEISEGITGEAFGSGRAVLVEDIENEPHFKKKVLAAAAPTKKHAKSYIATPITSGDYDLGILAVDCSNTNDGDIEAYAIVLNLVAEMFAEIIHKYELDDFTLYNAA